MGELPPRSGFPSDEEIIQYLTRKNNEEGFHTNRIHTVNFYDFDPDYLSGKFLVSFLSVLFRDYCFSLFNFLF